MRRVDPRTVDRIVDLASVALISIAALLSAVCGYQAGRWDGEETRLYNLADASRILAAEASDRANVLSAIDVAVFLQYINAVDAGDTRKAQFLYRRQRPEMRQATAAWLATKPLQNAKAPSSPFVMPQYHLRTRAEARSLDDDAKASFTQAQIAKRHSDDFLLLTIVFASVSFLAGMSTKMVYPRHAIVIAVGTLGLIYGLVRLAELRLL